MTIPQPLGPSGALKVAMELIDAQAKHIQALERGHWSRETRARVEELRDELEIVTAAERPDLTITHTETWKDGKLISDVETGRIDKAAEPLGTCPGIQPPTAADYAKSWADNIGHDNPATAYVEALARLQAARARLHPPHRYTAHEEGAWARAGECERCDILQPLHDAELKAHEALIRYNNGIPPEGVNPRTTPGWDRPHL